MSNAVQELLVVLQYLKSLFPSAYDVIRQSLLDSESLADLLPNSDSCTSSTLENHLSWLLSRVPSNTLSSILSNALPSSQLTPWTTTAAFFQPTSHTLSYNLLHSNLQPSFSLPPIPTPPLSVRQYFDGHLNTVHSLLFDHSNLLLVSAGEDRLVKIWNVETGLLRMSLRVHQNPITDLSISSDNLLLATSDSLGFSNVFFLHNGVLAYTLSPIHFNITSIKFSSFYDVATDSETRVLAVASEDGTIKLFNLGKLNDAHCSSAVTLSPFRILETC
ncbi:hypothetical protein GEMRC1_009199 [Eukaryota sp. GEM-RC1]